MFLSNLRHLSSEVKIEHVKREISAQAKNVLYSVSNLSPRLHQVLGTLAYSSLSYLLQYNVSL